MKYLTQRCLIWNSSIVADYIVILFGVIVEGAILVMTCYGIQAVLLAPSERDVLPALAVVAMVSILITTVFVYMSIEFNKKYDVQDCGLVITKPFSRIKIYRWQDIYKIDIGTMSVNKQHIPIIRVFLEKPKACMDGIIRSLDSYLLKSNTIIVISFSDERVTQISQFYHEVN